MRRASMDASYFDALYAEKPDPWSFETSDYERRKYEATLAALPRERYASALEVGCSIGVLTSQLARRCDRLVAIDPVERALAQARQRCADADNITFLQMEAPRDWPCGPFDLVLLSEVVYYLTHESVRALASRVETSLTPGAHVELVHWIRETDYPLSGDEAVELFEAASPKLTVIQRQRANDYRLEVFRYA